LKKVIEEECGRWKDLCLWIGKINIVKMATLSKITYKFNAIPFKIMSRLLEIEKKSKNS
jgi:hypothetical protein